MVVDDSAVIRGLLTRALEEDPTITVVASASNGEIALRSLARQDVEVVVLDIEMPVMDGLTALPLLLRAKPGIQVIMASTLTRKNADISMRAIGMGAADYIPKPTSRSELTGADSFRRELVTKVKALAQKKRGGRVATARVDRQHSPITSSFGVVKPKITLRAPSRFPPQVLAIGSSTGGPQALFKVLGELKDSLRVPIFITQHMPATFTTLLAEHLTRISGVPCAEAKDGEPVQPGRIYVAPGDYHMIVEDSDGKKVTRLRQTPPESFCRPAVDPMLRSLAKAYGSRLLTVILTGMGSDGLKGSQDVVAAGGTVIAQDEATSVVWGMPGAVAGNGVCSSVLPLEEIAPQISKMFMRSAA
jgi:two-component system chemotaxis response regulator CheB|tara:strand:- start:2382 stop:3461 length:1080 start_codon:yes stop_codon:yes gene_type:complete